MPYVSLLFLIGLMGLKVCSNISLIDIIITSIFLITVQCFKKKVGYHSFMSALQWIALGFLWISVFAYWQHSHALQIKDERIISLAQGYIASIPQQDGNSTRFLFALNKLQGHSQTGLVKLYSSNSHWSVHVGQQWQLHLKLKRPHGNLNPGGFDYEAWSFQAGIIGSGMVKDKIPPVLLSDEWYHYPIARIREYLQAKIVSAIAPSPTSVWIPALIIGERANVSTSQWNVLRRTGTNHLMAIAGLHIGIMSWFALSIVSQLWRLSKRLPLYWPADHAGLLAGLIMTLIYSSLSGFSLPAVRATLMMMLFVLCQLYRRYASMLFIFSCALLIVLVCNPLIILNDSFWLSFVSVALIIYGMGYRLAPKGLWWKWGRVQWVLGLGLLPLSLLFYQQFSLVSFVANMLTIPLVSCIIVPCVLIGTCLLCVSSTAGAFVLHIADLFLALTWKILVFLASWPEVIWYQSICSVISFSIALVGIIFLLLPKGCPGRILGLIYLMPFVWPAHSSILSGEIQLSVLDVGQGLSAIVQTQHHIMVYDAGPHRGDYDMGESVVVPYLRTLHIKALDLVVISHGDNDHIGGYEAIARAYPIRESHTSVTDKIPGSTLCLQGMHWQWDGVDFRYLYPNQHSLELNNDSSCVLRVSNGKKTLLLTGDIEKAAEKELLLSAPSDLSSNVIIVPHHGSKTSIVKPFLAAVHPEIALIGLGFNNRYHFPHALTLERYQDLGVSVFDTVKAGAIFLNISQEGALEPTFYRVSHHHYWNDLSSTMNTVADS